MEDRSVPTYAVFDDYRYYVRISVVVRWFLLAVWFLLHNTRVPEIDSTFYANNGLAGALAVLNGYANWRLWRGRPITLGHAIGLSAGDLLFITAGIFTTTGFGNTFFVLYYPALLAMALVFPSRRLSFGAVTLMAATYAILSIVTEPGVSLAAMQEKVLIIRVATMFAVVAAANLMHGVERRDVARPSRRRGPRRSATWSSREKRRRLSWLLRQSGTGSPARSTTASPSPYTPSA